MTAKAAILIVENESLVSLNIENRLLEMGYEVPATASSGEAAIQAAESTKPDLVLMDIRLNGKIDGIQAAEAIRDRFKIPVIYLTAYSDRETLQRAKITEPYGYIIKPFEARELGSVIEIALYKHRIDREVKVREQWLGTTLRSIGDGVITTDESGSITFMNPIAENLTGWQQDEVLGRPLSQIFTILDERTREPEQNPAEISLREGAIVGLGNHTILITKDGREIPIDDSAAPIKDEEDNITGAVLVFHDIIDRKQAELALRASEQRFRAIFDQAFQLIWLLQPDGNILEANQTVLDFAGIAAEEIVGCRFWDGQWWTLSPATQDQLRKAIEQAATGETVRLEVSTSGAAETNVTIDLSIKPVTAESGHVLLLIAEGRDISDRKRAEAALQKLNQELDARVRARTAELRQTIEQLEAEMQERQRTGEALRRSEERFRNLVETSNDLVWETDERNIYTYISPKVSDLLGYRPEELLGKTPYEILPEVERSRIVAISDPIFARRQSFTCVERANIHKDGHSVVLETSGVAFFNAEGAFRGYRGIDRDITERKQAEKELRESQRFIQRIADATPNMLYLYDLRQQRNVYVNQQISKILGYTPEQFQQMGSRIFPNLMHPEDLAKLPEYFQRIDRAADGDIFEIEYRMRNAGGEWRWLVSRDSVFSRTEGGTPKQIIGTATDISDRKQMEEQLRQTTTLQQAILDSANYAIISTTAEGTILTFNQAAERLLGYAASEMVGKTTLVALHDPDEVVRRAEELSRELGVPIAPGFEVVVAKARGGEVEEREWTYIRKDRSRFPVLLSVTALREPQGQIVGFLGIGSDITERQQAEEQLRLSERAISASSNGIIISDARSPDLPVLYVNPAFERMTGYSAAEVLGRNCRFLQTNDRNQPELDQLRTALREGTDCTVILRNYRKDGTRFWNELTISPIYDTRGNLTHFLGIQNDITQRQQTKKALLESEARLQAVIENTTDGLIVVNRDGIVRFVNPAAEILCCSSAEALLGENFGIPLTTAEADDICFIQQDNRIMTVDMRVTEINWDGEAAYLASLRDISDRKAAAEALRAAKEQLQAVLDAVPGLVCWIDRQNGNSYRLEYLGVNQHLADTFNYPAEEFVGKDIDFLENNQSFAELMRQFFASGDRQVTREIVTVVDSESRDYLMVAQKYNEGKAAVSVGLDITERKRAELELLLLQERLQYLLSSSPGAIYSCKATGDYSITFMSENVRSMLNYEAREFLENPDFWANRIHPDDRQQVLGNLSAIFEQGSYSREYRFQHRDGSYRWLYDQLKLVRDETGNPMEMIGYWADISDLKMAEEQIKQSLVEKETLLKEIHHRVKNNLQIISSLLRLQSRKIKDPEALKSFNDSQNRVRVMALVHEQLYRSESLSSINCRDYIQTLVGNLFRSFDASRCGVTFKIDIENIALTIDTAIPCGLAINEIVSNSLKYAFPGDRTGEIYLSLAQFDAEQLLLTVGDNGVGLPEDVDFRNTESLGLQLVCRLTKQIGGIIELTRDRGTEFNLTFSRFKQDNMS